MEAGYSAPDSCGLFSRLPLMLVEIQINKCLEFQRISGIMRKHQAAEAFGLLLY
jgi:hypothetical protein